MGSTEAQGAAPEKEKRETVGAWGGAGESEVIQRRVGKRRRERGRRQAQRSVRLPVNTNQLRQGFATRVGPGPHI